MHKNGPPGARRQRQFLERIAEIEERSPGAVAASCSIARSSSVRVNALSATPAEEIVAGVRADGFELEPIGWCPDAYHLRGDKSELAETRWFREGHVYIQTASSLLPALALDPQPGERILDAAAAPGGKAAHIAALVGNDCELHLNDPIEERVRRLEEVMRIYGVRYERITKVLGQYLDKELEPGFDRILLDAQCSGEGRIDLGHPGALRFWSENRIVKYGYLQRKMIVAAFRLLKPGGTLVYSTCTFAPEENEHVIDHLLRHHEADAEPIEIDFRGAREPLQSWRGHRFHPGVRHAWRVRPTEELEGFFVCRLRRRQ